MKTIHNIAMRTFLLGALTLLFVSTAGAAIAIEHWTQPSGAQVFLVPSQALPMLDVQLDFDAGGRRDPAGQAGLAGATAGLVGKGVRVGQDGAAGLDENALGEAWADLGASLSVHASGDRMSFALRSLTYPDLLPRAVQLAARQLADPAFAADVWQRERESWVAAIKEANTRPATLAGRAFSQAVYGSHPYGFDTTEATLGRISVTDIEAFYRALIQPCRAKVTVVGAVHRAQADALVLQLLAPLAGRSAGAACAALADLPEVAPLVKPVTLNIAFKSAQAHVLIGQPGYKRADPDHFALLVGNYILGGGGLVSRLTNEVREKRGLSYSVYSAFGPGLHAGAFTIGLETRPDQAEQALAVSRQVLADFVANGPTQEELQAAKDHLIGGFALLLDSNRKLLSNVANIAWHQLPLDYLDSWTQQVARVSVADVRSAFARKLQTDTMVTVVLGPTTP